MTIDILLATYNGEKYLRQQLDSFIHQTNNDWRLIVRDDGSTDNTQAILNEYEKKMGAGKMIRLHKSADAKVAATRSSKAVANFASLMEWSKNDGKAEYIMFSDQDDVWHPDKIEKTLTAMHELEKQHGKDDSLMVHTDVSSVFERGTHRGRHPSLKHGRRVKPEKLDFKSSLIQCVTQGCTMMMNRRLLEQSAPIPQQVWMHDMWVGLVAKAIGHVGYLSEATMDYRHHSENVLGGQHNRGMRAMLKRAVGDLDSLVEQAKALQRFEPLMPPERQKELRRFIEICKHSQPVRGALLYNEGYRRQRLEQNAVLFGGH